MMTRIQGKKQECSSLSCPRVTLVTPPHLKFCLRQHFQRLDIGYVSIFQKCKHCHLKFRVADYINDSSRALGIRRQPARSAAKSFSVPFGMRLTRPFRQSRLKFMVRLQPELWSGVGRRRLRRRPRPSDGLNRPSSSLAAVSAETRSNAIQVDETGRMSSLARRSQLGHIRSFLRPLFPLARAISKPSPPFLRVGSAFLRRRRRRILMA